MKTKAIIFDIDGTIVDSPGQKLPTQRTTDAFNKLSGDYYLSCATGRPWSFAKDIIEHLNTGDPSIVAAGTQIRTPNGTVLWQCSIDPVALEQVLVILDTYDQHSLLFNDYIEPDYLEDKGIQVQDFPTNTEIYFLETIFVPDSEALRLKERLDQVAGITCTMVTAQRPGTKDLHVTNEFATKEHAITELLKILQVDADQTIGVGDGHNDLHLFAAVKTKIAMGNAVPELKDVADMVIGDVKEDGLAVFLETLATRDS